MNEPPTAQLCVAGPQDHKKVLSQFARSKIRVDIAAVYLYKKLFGKVYDPMTQSNNQPKRKNP